MKNRTMTTNIGTINLAEMELMTDCMEVFIPITVISENLKSTIEENIQKAKEEHQKKFLDCRNEKWGDAGIVMNWQSLHIVVKEKALECELCFDFEDAENDNHWTGFRLDVDLSAYESELKKLILKEMINKFF